MPGFRTAIPVLSSVIAALTLSACGGSAVPNGPDNPDVPTPPGDAPKALVVGEADSPFLDVLREKVEFLSDFGTQQVSDYDLLVFDGHAHTPAALAEHARLQEAFSKGVPVLLIDAATEHKQQGVIPYLGFATENDTDAIMFRQVPGRAMPTYDVLEMPRLPETDSQGLKVQQASRTHQHQAFADRVVNKLGSGACNTPLNIESGIIYATWCYSQPLDWEITQLWLGTDRKGTSYKAGDQLTLDTKGNPVILPSQKGENAPNYTFTVLLNNVKNVTGDFQTVHVEVDGQMTPTKEKWPNSIGAYAAVLPGKPLLMGDIIPGEFTAYPQSNLDVTLGPSATSTGILSEAATYAPQTPNSTEIDSYDSTSTFSVSATLNASIVPRPGIGRVTGNYTTTNTQTKQHTISDWSWTVNETSAKKYNWQFRSTNPAAGSLTPGTEWQDAWWGNWHLPLAFNLNNLNQYLLAYGTSAVWNTKEVSTDVVKFDVSSTQSLPALLVGRSSPKAPITSTFLYSYDQTVSQTVSLDLGAVIPVTLKADSLSFKDQAGNPITQTNPAVAGQDVTATVQLSGAAPFGYEISSTATSANNNASIAEDPVKISQGATNQTFTIETNANGLATDGMVAVPITLGSFGSTATQQLWISNKPSLDLAFSDTTVHIAQNPTRTGSVTLSEPAPAGGITVNLSLFDFEDNTPAPNAATFPSSVTIRGGQTSANVPITFSTGGPQGNAFGYYLHADGGDWGSDEVKFVVSQE